MFVDIADNVSVVDRVKLSYIYDDVDNEEVSVSLGFLRKGPGMISWLSTQQFLWEI